MKKLSPQASPVAVGSAPGRLDFLGGVADYSGALVLEMPIRAQTHVTIYPTSGRDFIWDSTVYGATRIPVGWMRREFFGAGSPALARAALEERAVPRWMHYPLGCLWVFSRKTQWQPATPFRFVFDSQVPESMGVSSSAALEIATLRALVQLSQLKISRLEIARLGQEAENTVVGAPCGLMDQLASACGVSGKLLPILCRPDVLDRPLPLPKGIILVGWPSGVKHSVADRPYATARTAAFMGLKIVQARRTSAYASDIPLEWWRKSGTQIVPATLKGQAFLDTYGAVDDPLSVVEPDRSYPVRAALDFPIREQARTHQTVELLRTLAAEANPEDRTNVLRKLGQFLAESHQGYTAMGLGAPETDEMVQSIRKLGPRAGFYGARISGGGSGGTVVVLLEKNALPRLEELRVQRATTSQSTPELILS